MAKSGKLGANKTPTFPKRTITTKEATESIQIVNGGENYPEQANRPNAVRSRKRGTRVRDMDLNSI